MRASTHPRERETGAVLLYASVMTVTAGLALGVALLGTRSAPQYSSTAEIVIGPTLTPSGNYIQPSMPTEQRVATSTGLVTTVAAALGVPSEDAQADLSVSVPVDTDVLVMTYTADSAEDALAGAQAFADTYLLTRNPGDGADPVARLVSPPELATDPVGANYPVVLGAALLGGLVTGFVVARTWDRVRGRVRSVADAEGCAGLDALALTPPIPRSSLGPERDDRTQHPQLDSLAARVIGQVESGPQPIVLVTGAEPDCGSTAVAAATALAVARMGNVAVLVTADDDVVRRLSRDHHGQRGINGSARTLWPDARAGEQEGLHIVPMAAWDTLGVATGRLSTLLPRLHEALPEALIVIDGPPAWASSGLAWRADKVLLVVALGRSTRRATSAAAQALDHCGDRLMGLVVTPRRRPGRADLLTLRAWVSRQIARITSHVAPPAIEPAPTAARLVPFDEAPARATWTDRSTDVSGLLTVSPNGESSGSRVS